MKVSNDPVALLCRKSIQFDGPKAVSEKETRNVMSVFVALRGYVWVETIHQIPSGRLGKGMRMLEQIS